MRLDKIDIVEAKTNDSKTLEKMKAMEQGKVLKQYRLDSRTTIYYSSESRLEEYKHKFK